MGFGLRAIALEVHRQARQLIPGALITLEIDAVDGFRRQRVYAGSGAAGQYQAGKKDQQ